MPPAISSSTQRKTKKVAIIAACVLVILPALFWEQITDAFAPMQQSESLCLVCQRERSIKWVCGKKVSDSISPNQYSDWVDTFVPAKHSHLWLRHTFHHREHWFGSKTIGCGGGAVIPRIFDLRNRLGEQKARQLVAKWHECLAAPTINLSNPREEIDAFLNEITSNPESQLQTD